MCRTGGRRCENHWTPEQKAADNARRRAIYAARKTAPVAGESSTLQRALQKVPSQTSSLYAEELITGRINPSQITEESYTEYGFVAPKEHKSLTKAEEFKLWKECKADSRDHLRPLTVDEKVALGVFTTGQYRQLSLYLHDSPQIALIDPSKNKPEWNQDNEKMVQETEASFGTEPEPDVDPVATTENKLNLSCAVKASRSFVSNTPEGLTSYTEAVDSAFSKAAGKQRIVYRGERLSADHFGEHENVREYVANELALGSKVSFKGVQSTSTDRNSARRYCGGYETDGIMYEIRTPSGINITAVSSFDYEQEVLLPRNSQYRVVGVHYTDGATRSATNAIIQLVEVDDDDNIRTGQNLRKENEFGDRDFTKYFNTNKETN